MAQLFTENGRLWTEADYVDISGEFVTDIKNALWENDGKFEVFCKDFPEKYLKRGISMDNKLHRNLVRKTINRELSFVDVCVNGEYFLFKRSW